MKVWQIGLGVVCGGLLVGAGALLSRPVREPFEGAAATRVAPPLESVSCKKSLRDEALSHERTVECFRLTLPESDRSAQKIRLAIARIAPQAEKEDVPLLVLPGGPGDAWGPDLSERLDVLLPIAKDREIIVVDPRGTGLSEPALECIGDPNSPGELARCYRDLSATHDLSAYSTESNASDLRAVLDELEIARVHVLGVSYGALVALVLSSRHPELVESLVLDSFGAPGDGLLASVALSYATALERVFHACDEAPSCAAQLSGGYAKLLELLEGMREGSIDGPMSGQKIAFEISQVLYTPEATMLLPLLVHQMSLGDFSLFQRVRQGLLGHSFSFAEHLSVQCAEQMTDETEELMREREGRVPPILLPAFTATPYLDYCRTWDVPRIGVSIGVVHAPTLVLSGGWDPVGVGKPSDMRFDEMRALEFSTMSHGVAFSECGAEVVATFLREGTEFESPSCIHQANTPQFVLSASDESVDYVVHRMRHRL